LKTIYGPDGKPVNLAALTKYKAQTVQVDKSESVASGLTPGRLASILADAKSGDEAAFFTLAEEMEERNLHLISELGKRKRAVKGLEITVESGSTNANHVRHAEEVGQILKTPAFKRCIMDLLDGIGKSRSVVEMRWETGAKWKPVGFEWRDPRLFRYVNGDVHRLVDNNQTQPLEPFRYIVHRPTIKTGQPITSSIAFLAAFYYMANAYGYRDWLSFIESYDQPYRLGRYDAGASDEDVDTLRRAVANIGTDCGAILPRGMDLDFIDIKRPNQGDVYKQFVLDLREQLSIAILGQCSTTMDGGSYGQAYVLNEIRRDILESDADELGDTLEQYLVRPYVDANYGPQDRYPSVSIPVPDAEDLEKLANALSLLVPIGLRVDEAVIRERMGLPAPEEGAVLLGVTAPASKDKKPKSLALNRLSSPPSGEEDGIYDDGFSRVLDPKLATIQAALDGASSYEGFMERITEILASDPNDDLVKSLGLMLIKARGLGNANV